MALDFGPEINDYHQLYSRVSMRDFFTPTTPPYFYEVICKKKPLEEVKQKWEADRKYVERQNESDIKNHLHKYPEPTFDPFGLLRIKSESSEVNEDASITV